MIRKFQASIHTQSDGTLVRLSGLLDEDNDLATFTNQISGITIINFSEIERINSCGVRDWVNWLEKAEKSGARVVLVECSPAIVAQINLVHNFTGQGVVKSFFAPYFCPHCNLEKVLLVETRDLSASQARAPSCRCDECDGPMDFDDMEESYFSFLKSTRKIVTDTRYDQVLSALAPIDTDRKSRARNGAGGSSMSASGSPNGSAGVLSRPGNTLGASLSSIPSVPGLRTPNSLFGGHTPNGLGTTNTNSRVAAALAELEARRAQSSPAIPHHSDKSNATWMIALGTILIVLALIAFFVLRR